MHIRVQQVNVPLHYNESVVAREVGRKIGCLPALLTRIRVIRRSLDTRPRNPEPVYALMVEAELNLPRLPIGAPRAGIDVLPDAEPTPESRVILPSPVEPRPIVVGAGPAGLMAAYGLALAGARPILVERGEDAASRAPKAARFWNEGVLDPESNVLYGEGGAGLFSDGKLTARSKERGRIQEFVELLHACGAEESVLIDSEPHVGSDALLKIVPRLRRRIEEAGGEIRFRSRLDSLIIENGRLRAVIVNGHELSCNRCVVAVGHSARDFYEMLGATGVALTAKPFAVGVRLELPQAAIDRAQYGKWAGNPLLGAASFRLTRREEPGTRACYSFCMCPGGKVISCASEPGFLTTNGMSYSKRLLAWGNAAFLVPVGTGDYPEHAIPALAGLAFQRGVERLAFDAAGGAYAMPAVRLVDFLSGRLSTNLPEGRSGTRAKPADLRQLFPECVTLTLQKAIPPMLRELNGVNLEDAVLYAPETRSSSPIRIERDDGGESINTRGLFPAGEGAGYAGGIVSSAIDGMRAAEQVLKSLSRSVA